MASRAWLLFAGLGLLAAADLGPDLLTAARKGQTTGVRALLDKGAPLESRNKEGRTPLMLSAQHGHSDSVALLLGRGADAGARDNEGWTAYGLALFSQDAGRERILKALPPPRPWRLALEAVLAPGNLYSSCSMSPPQLAQFIGGLHLDTLAADTVREAAIAGAGTEAPVALVAAEPDAVASLRVRPQVSCVQQDSSDNLSLAIDVRVTVKGSPEPLLDKTFGGGLKGLHARRAASPVQYRGLFADWAKNHAGPIYWAVVAALLKYRIPS